MRENALPRTEPPEFTVEIPGGHAHGDFAANVAMTSARLFQMPPLKIAEEIIRRLRFDGGRYFERAEIAGPGFLNFFLRPEWRVMVLSSILELGEKYGHTNFGKGKKVMVEFVSANPTGPMHIGNARGGAIGDVLASALYAAGYDVSREFYVNDAGTQIEKFGESLEARYLQFFKGEDAVPFPEDLYQGEDIKDRVKGYIDAFGEKLLNVPEKKRRHELVRYALPRNINDMREILSSYHIEYNTWFHESSLYSDGTIEEVLDTLKESALVYKKDGALWYKSTDFGGGKDEVLVRKNGSYTYFMADIAYHYNKFTLRGHQKVIDVWGADHHGHVARLKGAMDALGIGGDKLDILILQMVRLIKDGEPYRMSKRLGRGVSLSDLLELVPLDAARFFFNMTSPAAAMDFDLDLAAEQSSKNPVYYVQYAHARICSILKKLEENGIVPRDCTDEELLLLKTPEEEALIHKLAQFPSEIVWTAENYDPSRITHYAIDTASLFHKFYTNRHVQIEDEPLMQARICLCTATRTTIANALELLKISAPESM
jgi:arginyl-tRNA synthetase